MRLQAGLLVSLIWLTGCASDAELAITCEVRYHVDTAGTYTLPREWRLIGLRKNGSSEIDSPPCERRRSRNEITLAFSDTVHNLSRSIYPYPNIVGGQGPVNGFGASYQTEDGGRIMISPLLSTMMGGSNVLIDYEKQYFGVVWRARRYEITNNLLTLIDDQGNKALFVAIIGP